MKVRRDTYILNLFMKDEHIRVLITNATSAVGIQLAVMVAAGEVFGAKQFIILHLLDKPEKCASMEALKNELMDCVYPQLKDVLITCDPVVAFENISVAFLLGARRPDPTLAQRENITSTIQKFKDYGLCLNMHARKDCKVLVAAEPSNTLCYICAHYASSLPSENFSALARLNQNRAMASISAELKAHTLYLQNVIIWGNLWSTFHIDSRAVTIRVKENYINIKEIVKETGLKDLYARVESYGKQINAGEEQICVFSLAKAVCDQMHDWWLGTPANTFVSMAVMSNGSYNTPRDIVFSYPVEVHRGKWSIVTGVKLDEATRYKIDAAGKELIEEKNIAMSYISVGDDISDGYDMKVEVNFKEVP